MIFITLSSSYLVFTRQFFSLFLHLKVRKRKSKRKGRKAGEAKNAPAVSKRNYIIKSRDSREIKTDVPYFFLAEQHRASLNVICLVMLVAGSLGRKWHEDMFACSRKSRAVRPLKVLHLDRYNN